MRVLGFILLLLGVISFVISLPIVGFAALGYLGILADVGPNENRAIGAQALWFGLPPLMGGVALGGLGFLALARGRRCAQSKAGTGPDRGSR